MPTSVKVTKKPTAKTPQTMEELLASENFELKAIKRGQVIEGTILAITPVEVLVDIGGKSEGVISGRELGDGARELAAGQKILAYVMQSEDDSGRTILSIKRAGGERRWRQLQDEFTSGTPVECRGIETNRGGLVVDLDGVRGFIPSSQLDSSNSGSLGIGKHFTAKIIELDRKGNRLVLSQRQMSAEANRKKFEDAAKRFSSGQEISGKVSGIMPYGLFVTLDDGIEGLVHISEVSWERVSNLSERFKVGDTVTVKVLNVDPSAGRINLSIKALQADPWKDKIAALKPGDKVKGEVIKLTQFGVFVQIEQGVDGLIRTGKIPEYMVDIKPGQTMDLIVETVDPAQRRISLLVDEGVGVDTLKPIEELVADAFTQTPSLEPKKKTKAKTKKD